MNIGDLLIMVIVVTVFVTIVLGGITYLAYKLRRARRPVPEEDPGNGFWYFIRYKPGGFATEMPMFLRPTAKKVISGVTSPGDKYICDRVNSV